MDTNSKHDTIMNTSTMVKIMFAIMLVILVVPTALADTSTFIGLDWQGTHSGNSKTISQGQNADLYARISKMKAVSLTITYDIFNAAGTRVHHQILSTDHSAIDVSRMITILPSHYANKTGAYSIRIKTADSATPSHIEERNLSLLVVVPDVSTIPCINPGTITCDGQDWTICYDWNTDGQSVLANGTCNMGFSCNDLSEYDPLVFPTLIIKFAVITARNPCFIDAIEEPVCGNSIVETGEICDNDDLACTTSAHGYSGSRECASDCSTWGACIASERCGDGIENGDEECDDGNTQNNDGCSAICESETSQPICGNNIVESPEVCDGNSQSCVTAQNYAGTRTCNPQCAGWNSCVSTQYCGDGTKNGNEQCDDGNTDNNDACTNSCASNTQFCPGNKPADTTCINWYCDNGTWNWDINTSYNQPPICAPDYCIGTSRYTFTPQSDSYCDANGGLVTGTCLPATITPNSTLCGAAQCSDNDDDDYSPEGGDCGPVDCHDFNPWMNPGETELCDGIDNDCNGQTDEGNVCGDSCTDDDDDLYSPDGGVCGPIDCDDNNLFINPGAYEFCDNIDNDCDGNIDETFPLKGQICGAGVGACARAGNYVCDSNSLGLVCNAVLGLPTPEICGDNIDQDCDGADLLCGICQDNDSDGYNSTGGSCGIMDCDDALNTTYPGAIELCDGIDNDCDTIIDNDCQNNNGSLNVSLNAIPENGTAPLMTELNCGVSNGTAPYNYEITVKDSDGNDVFWNSELSNSGLDIEYALLTTNGAYTASCNVTDNSGLLGIAYDTITVSNADNDDSTAPEVVLLSPPNGTVLRQNNITLIYIATDDISSTLLGCNLLLEHEEGNGSTISYLDYAVNIPSGIPQAVSFTNVLESNYSWNVVCTDQAGNQGTAPQPYYLTINKSAERTYTTPLVVITSPADNSLVLRGNVVQFRGIVSDVEDPEQSLIMQWTSSIDGTLDNAPADIAGMAGFDISTLSLGMHTITLTAIDSDGMMGQDSISLIVDDVPSGQEPNIIILSPNNGTYMIRNILVNMTSDDPNAAISYFLDGMTETAFTGAFFNIFSDGWHTLIAVARNAYGTAMDSVRFFVDTSGNDDTLAPVITLISPADGSTVYHSLITFTFDVQDDSGIAGCSLFIDNIPAQMIDASIGAGSFVQELNNGQHAWRVACQDDYGNEASSQSWNININAVLPYIPQDSDEEDNEVLDPEQILYLGHIEVGSQEKGFRSEEVIAGGEARISVNIQNLAPYKIESLKASFFIPDLGVWRSSDRFSLAAGKSRTVEVRLPIDASAAAGVYDVHLSVSNDDLTRAKNRQISVVDK